jgi:hypothetical protein
LNLSFVRRHQVSTGEKPIPSVWPLKGGYSKRKFLGPVTIYEGMWWTLSNLLEDEAIVLHGEIFCTRIKREWRRILLTPKGQRLVERVANGEPL